MSNRDFIDIKYTLFNKVSILESGFTLYTWNYFFENELEIRMQANRGVRSHHLKFMT